MITDNIEKETLLNIIKSHCYEEHDWNNTDEITFSTLHIDSLKYISLLVSIEDTFHFRYDDSSLVMSRYKNLTEFITNTLQIISKSNNY